MAEVKVLGSWSSPFTARVKVALKLKGVEYEFIEEDLSNKSPLLLKSNPVHNQIPVLLHNGNPIAESLVILEYIDDTFPGTPILPKHPYERAVARFWAKFFDEKFSPAARKVRYTKGEEQEKAKEEVRELLKVVDNELKKKKFLGGETIGLADIAGNFVALWVGVLAEVLGVELGMTEQKFPNLCRWMEDFLNCNVIKETFPPRDKLVAHYNKRFKSAAASASE
ncbi:PREDICTED: probable glutathione S-transferase isoform X1 [Ipomoea nil]|uniref:probable glutathione S-transferase isoform X1 n=1 Tax=Ipomoea nil TaxID=35883 RepID=UPI000901D1C8|nr:PREDICTED: probable glutathione S-transferase isoform X1 [Ipomoea nil]